MTYSVNNALFMSPITVGPASTMNVAGKMNSTNGKLIFTEALAAISSAACWRLLAKGFGVDAQRVGDACAETVRLDQHRRQRLQRGVARALSEIFQRFRPRQPDARLHVGDSQLTRQRRMRQAELLTDPLHRRIHRQSGFDAHDHQVQRIGQRQRQRSLVGFFTRSSATAWA